MPEASTQTNVVSLLQKAAARVPARAALITCNTAGATQSISFQALWERCARFAGGLQAHGLCPGERVIIMVPMSIDLYVTMLGVLAAGGTAVFIDPWISVRAVAAFSALAEPYAFIGTARSHLLRLLDPRLRRVPFTVLTGGRRVWRWPARHSWHEIGRHPGVPQPTPVTADASALITFTTGSSGKPKGVDRTHGFLSAQHRALQATFPGVDGDVDLPMFPIFALHNLAAGITSVLPRQGLRRATAAAPEAVAAQMRAQGVTTVTASPPFLDRLVEWVTRSQGARWTGLRRILTGGAPVTDTQLQRWRLVFPQTGILVVYGSTEAEPVAWVSAEERLATTAPTARQPHPGFCLGRPVPSLRTRVVRISREPIRLSGLGWREWELPPGTVGELVVCGDHVGRGYFRNPEAVAETKIIDAEGQNWHRMGDTGYFDMAGRFWLVGRVHTTICRGGTAFHAQQVEHAALAACDGADEGGVQRVAAVGLPDPLLGERLVLVAESARRDAPTLAEDLRQAMLRRSVPVDAVMVTRRPLPLDPRHNAKIDYAELRRRLCVPPA